MAHAGGKNKARCTLVPDLEGHLIRFYPGFGILSHAMGPYFIWPCGRQGDLTAVSTYRHNTAGD